jgi:hypothetical protein
VLCKHGYDDYELGEDEHFLDELEQDMDWRHRIDDTESEEDESEEDESDEDMDSD